MASLAVLLALLGWWAPLRAAEPDDGLTSCPELAAIPEDLQVAWVSPVRRRVRGRSSLSVVRVADLRVYVQREQPDAARLLQTLGLVGSRGRVHRRYKLTLFDVSAEQLCRPVEHTAEGELADGLPACPAGQQEGARRVSGCGFTWDSAADARGLDLFRISWREAARNGFCVMPLERFLSGA